MNAADLTVAAGAALVAGVVNAVAGGGTLVSFPALVALGVPAVSANVTNTVSLVPGYVGAAYAQRRELLSFRGALRGLIAVAAAGGLVGAVLVLLSPADLFDGLVPVLIVAGCVLLGLQDVIKRWVARRRGTADAPGPAATATLVAVFAVAIYGGYFGAGLGIVLLGVLGITLDEPLARLNSLKAVLSIAINVVAAGWFVFSDKVVWEYVAVMAVGSVIGGAIGGKLSGRLNPKVLRIAVIVFGCVVAVANVF